MISQLAKQNMNLEKAQKRIDKRVKRGFHGYPMITIQYFGETEALATRVEVAFIEQENANPLVENFETTSDIRLDETVQTTIIKIIERVDAKTVSLKKVVTTL